MTKKITFSAFGRDSYYHRDWFKKNGFKFNRSSRKWTVQELPVEHAEGFASYCRKYGLTFERSDRMITDFDYLEYLWDWTNQKNVEWLMIIRQLSLMC